jgi:hypothetical protein
MCGRLAMNRLWNSYVLNFSHFLLGLGSLGLGISISLLTCISAEAQDVSQVITPEKITPENTGSTNTVLIDRANTTPSAAKSTIQTSGQNLTVDPVTSTPQTFTNQLSSSESKIGISNQTDSQTINQLEFRGYSSQNPELPDVPEPAPGELKQDAPSIPTPLQKPPIRLFNLETANQLSAGEFNTALGVVFFFKDQIGQGTGLQVFNGSVDAGLTDSLQLGIAAAFFDDDLGRTISGLRYKFRYAAIAPNAKYQIFQNESLSLSAAGSVEFLSFKNGPDPFYHGAQPTIDANTIVGTIQFPLTYNVFNRDLQVHLTPGVAVFPSSLSNLPFYGTIFNLGAGVSWKAMDRLSLFADVSAPIAGNNAVSSNNGSYFKKLVYSAGLRYLVNPAVGLDVYATNALGTTPATRFLAFLPDGDQVALSTTLNYAFGKGSSYAPSFRPGKRVQLSKRDKQLLLDGLTLTTAATLEPGTIALRAGGIKSELGFNIAYGLTNDVQLEVFGEHVRNIPNRSDAFRLGGAAKLRFLDQAQGDIASLGVRGAFAVDTSGDRGAGGFFTVEVPATYQATSDVAFFVNPKIGFLGSATSLPLLNRVVAGVGLGVNYALFGIDGLQLVGEFTPVFTGDRSIWSAGVRYFNSDLNLGADLYGSNSVSNYAARGVVTDNNGSAGIGLNVHWLFGGN